MSKNQLDNLVQSLTKSFEQWEHIFKDGCQDPFHCDGVNLWLVRNHIISYKKQIDELLKSDSNDTLFSLFPVSYPDIYYKPTPKEVSFDYMAQPDKIRSRAVEQMAKFEQDPNFCYIRDHYKDVFPNGETKATKAAGLYPGKYSRFIRLQKVIEQDNLVNMRCLFRIPYEEQINDLRDCANEIRNYLSLDHSKSDNIPISDEYYTDEYEEAIEAENSSNEFFESSQVDISPKKNSLDEKIKVASAKADKQEKQTLKEWGEQLSLF